MNSNLGIVVDDGDTPAAPTTAHDPPLPDVSQVKPAAQHMPISKEQVDAFASRMEDISRIVHEYLNEDPIEAAERKRQREAAREEEKKAALRQKLHDRYDPKRYVRFESDELINKLLAEADKPSESADTNKPPAHQRISNLSDFEKLQLEEAERGKAEGNAKFKSGDWEAAKRLYTNAIRIECLDDELNIALHNNRSQVSLNVKDYVQAVEDASFVIRRHPNNTKARLRRATALSALHRPHEALEDLQVAVRGDPKNVEALRLIDSVTLEKVEIDLCHEFERSCKSAASDIKHLCRDLADVATHVVKSGADPTTTLRTAISGATTVRALVDLADAILGDKGAATMVRIHGGVESARSIVKRVGEDLVEISSHADKGCTIAQHELEALAVALSSGLRLLAGCNASCVTVATTPHDDAKFWIDICGALAARTGALYKFLTSTVDTCRTVRDKAVAKRTGKKTSENDLSGVVSAGETALPSAAVRRSALQFLSSCSPHSALQSLIVGALSVADMKRLVANLALTDVALYYALRMFDTLLRNDAAVAAYATEVDFLLPALAALSLNSIPFCEAGIAVLLRLSVVTPDKADILLRRPEVLATLVDIVRRSVKDPSTSSSILDEGILSLIYNRLVQCNPRNPLVEALHKSELFDAVVTSLIRYLQTQVSSAETARESLNTAARQLAVLGKSVSVNPDVAKLLVKHEEDVLWKTLSVIARLFALSTVEGGDRLVNNDVTPDTRTYAEQCVEHSSLCLAILYTNKHVDAAAGLADAERLKLLLSLLQLKQQPVAVGNVAMVLSLVPASSHDVFGQLQCVELILQALIDLRTDVFDLERRGQRGSSQHTQTKAAQKNCAIALSRVCATESLLQRVRDAKGFEILYAALDRNPDGSVKE